MCPKGGFSTWLSRSCSDTCQAQTLNPKAMQHTRECQLSSLRSASGQAARGTAQNAFCTATGRFTPSAVLRMTVCCRPMITQETLTPQSVDDSSQPEVQRQRNKVLLDGIEKTLKPKP